MGRAAEPLTVSEITSLVAGTIRAEPRLVSVRVRGEVSNFKHHMKRHMYFSLKDGKSVLRCVFFHPRNIPFARRLGGEELDGTEVVAGGSVKVFSGGGTYQLYVDSVEEAGLGERFAAFEELKKRLLAEGLIGEEGKRRIPPFPHRVGVATSSEGAAVRDIRNVLSRRWPLATMVLRPVPVQGDLAAPALAEGIIDLARRGDLDLMIVGRGGGAIEDLWAFNTEVVARAIAGASRDLGVPVISAVGHETDYLISDMVADLRAPTPSAGAELAVPDAEEIRQKMASVVMGMERRISGRIALAKDTLSRLSRRMRSPADILAARLERLKAARVALTKRSPLVRLSKASSSLSSSAHRIRREMGVIIRRKEAALSAAGNLMRVASPRAIMARGFSIVKGPSGAIIRSAEDVSEGDEITITPSRGEISARVREAKT